MSITRNVFNYSLFSYFFLGVGASSSFIYERALIKTLFQLGMIVSFFCGFIFFCRILVNAKFDYFLKFLFLLLLLVRPNIVSYHTIVLIVFSFIIYYFSEGRLEDFFEGIKPAYYGTFFAVLFAFVLLKLGISENKIFYVSTSQLYKSSAGFYNPNAAGIYSAGLIILSLFLRIKYLKLIIILFSLLILYEVKARASIGLVVIFAVLYFFIHIFKTKEILTILILGFAAVMLAFMFYISSVILWQENDLFLGDQYSFIDYVTSFRASLLSFAVSSIPPSSILFGSFNQLVIEMGWFNIISNFGILLPALFLLLSFFFIRKINVKEAKFLLLILYLFLVGNIFESYLVSYNIVALLCFYWTSRFIFAFFKVSLSIKYKPVDGCS